MLEFSFTRVTERERERERGGRYKTGVNTITSVRTAVCRVEEANVHHFWHSVDRHNFFLYMQIRRCTCVRTRKPAIQNKKTAIQIKANRRDISLIWFFLIYCQLPAFYVSSQPFQHWKILYNRLPQLSFTLKGGSLSCVMVQLDYY